MNYSLSWTAVTDLQAIDTYTAKRFGVEQAVRAAGRFRDVFRALAERPQSCRVLEELSTPGRELRGRTVLGNFVVVYQAGADGIHIVRVIHGARHLARELDRDPGPSS